MKKFLVVLLVCLFAFPFGAKAETPSCSAKAGVLIESDSGRVLYSKNAYDKLPMASTTKIMTAILLIENANLEEEIICTKEMVTVEGSSMGLMAGDRVRYFDLLYGLMLASGNDSANTIAISLSGSTKEFAKLMNKKAKQLNLKDTHFVTPSGLDDVEHYTTAYDLAQLARYAMQNETFCKAVSSKNQTLFYGNPPYRRTLSNHNKLLSFYDKCNGVKTGFTKKSGRCLVSSAVDGEKSVICVTLSDPNDWRDHQSLLEWGLDKIDIKTLPPHTERINAIGTRKKIEIKSESVRLSTLEGDEISKEVKIDKYPVAPIKKGEILGEIEYKINGQVSAVIPLKATGQTPADTTQKDLLYWIKKLIIS